MLAPLVLSEKLPGAVQFYPGSKSQHIQDMTSFGEFLRDALAAKGFTQKSFGDALRVKLNADANEYGQPTISRWISDESLPRKSDVLTQIAVLLNADKAELMRLTQAERDKPRTVRDIRTPELSETREFLDATSQESDLSPLNYGLKVTAYFDKLEEKLLEFPEGEICEAWFVGPDSIPALNNDYVYQKWIENMQERNVEYHIMWVFDLVSEITLEQMEYLLDTMNDTLSSSWDEKQHCRFFLHGFSFSDRVGQPAQARKNDFMELKKHIARYESKWCHAIVDFETEQYDEPTIAAMDRLKYYAQGWATIICYCPKTKAKPLPFASAAIDCLRLDWSTSIEKGNINYLLFCAKTSSSIFKAIEPFKEEFRLRYENK